MTYRSAAMLLGMQMERTQAALSGRPWFARGHR
jgi:hypothetical protein